MSSNFEMFSLLKKGKTCIVGDVTRGVQWNIVACDYLLLQAIHSGRYSKIICLLVDRSKYDLDKTFETLKSNFHDVIHIVQPSIQDPLNIIYDNIMNSLHTDINNQSKLLLINSLSELILGFGQVETRQFLTRLDSLDIQQVITNINRSYHSNIITNYLTSYFSTVSNITPNDGTFSSEVVVQIHTLWRSTKSGRISESIELFANDSKSYLRLCAPSKSHNLGKYDNVKNDVGSNDSLAEVVTTKLHGSSTSNYNDSHGQSEIQNSGLDTLKQSTSSSISSIFNIDNDNNNNNTTLQSSEVKSQIPPILPNSKRLIIFDSTDPEFDEDSDPDNDLDL